MPSEILDVHGDMDRADIGDRADAYPLKPGQEIAHGAFARTSAPEGRRIGSRLLEPCRQVAEALVYVVDVEGDDLHRGRRFGSEPCNL